MTDYVLYSKEKVVQDLANQLDNSITKIIIDTVMKLMASLSMFNIDKWR